MLYSSLKYSDTWLEYRSVIKYILSMHEALALIPNTKCIYVCAYYMFIWHIICSYEHMSHTHIKYTFNLVKLIVTFTQKY